MMYRKNISTPVPDPGISFENEPDLCIPDQSLSLHEILERFTRGEAVPAGHDTMYGSEYESEIDVDLEKMATADLVDKDEYKNRLKDVQFKYEKQEKAKKAQADKVAAEAAKAADEERIRLAAEKLAKENSK